MLSTLALMGVAFLVPPASAANGVTVPNTQHANCSLTNCTIGITVSNVGDVIVFIYESRSNNQTYGNIVTSISDGGDAFRVVSTQSIKCTTCGGGVGQQAVLEYFAATALVSGAITVSITQARADGAGVDISANSGLETFDIAGAQVVPTATATGQCSLSAGCPSPAATLANNNVPAAAAEVAGFVAFGCSTIAAGTSYTLVDSAAFGVAEYSASLASTVTAYPFTTTGANCAFELVSGAVFSAAASTGSNNVVTAGGVTGSVGAASNTTAKYLTTNSILYYFSQNMPAAGSVDNFTIHVAAVHINAASGTLHFVIYMPATPTIAAGPGNLWTQVPGSPFDQTVFNGTTNFFIHVGAALGTQVCKSCYFMAGVMATTTKSNSASVLLSGISLYQTSQTGVTEYSYAVGSGTPPATFYAASSHAPHDWIFCEVADSIATVTITSVSTVGGTATTTTTITSTTLDMNLAVNSGVDYSILILVILLPAFALAVPIAAFTKSAQATGIAFVAGLMLGSGIGVQDAIVPPVFLGLTVLIGVFLIVGLSRGGGGT